MKNVKKTLSLILVAVMLLCSLPMAVSAAEYTENGYTYTVADGKATITGADSTITGNITIPSTLGGYPVVAIGDNAFNNNQALTGVSIPSSVKTIDEAAFCSCYQLATVTLNEGLEVIGSFAFAFDHWITEIDIPASVKSIGENAFLNCVKLATINFLGDNIEYIGGLAFGLTAWVNALPGGEIYVGGSYYYCNSIMPENATMVIKDGTKGISYDAFSGQEGLTKVIIPSSAKNIGAYAFYRCNNLSSVVFGSGVTTIGEEAFIKCPSLKKVVIPESVTSIGTHAFGYDSSYVKVEGFTIEGFAGSAAEEYASANGFTFVEHSHADNDSDDLCDTCGASLKEHSALNDKTAKILAAVFEFIVFLVDAIIKLAQSKQAA